MSFTCCENRGSGISATSDAIEEYLTSPGTAMGTVAYNDYCIPSSKYPVCALSLWPVEVTLME